MESSTFMRALLVLSFLTVSNLATLSPASACDCVGSQCPPQCSGGVGSSEPVTRIRYTITNNTDRVVRFGLPSGRTYELEPGQRRSYRNTGSQDSLGIVILNTSERYRLSSGDFQFRENSDGEIIFSFFNRP
jgi:hypothetical protein